MDSELQIKPNEFYFIVNSSGQYLKTRFKKDFDVVKTWKTVIFADIVSNSKTIYFMVGTTTQKKRINQLKIAKPQKQTKWIDICELDLKSGNKLNQINIGGRDENYERL